MKRLIKKFINYLGYDITHKKASRTHDMDKEFFPIYKKCHPISMTSIEAKYALYGAVNYVIDKDIPGDFVECGVWKGGSCLLIADTMVRRGVTDRKIYLYDTFAGMSEPEDIDVRSSSKMKAYPKWKALQREDHNEWCYSSLEEVKANLAHTLYPQDNFVFVKGKVEDTIPLIIPERIAILRLDTDWYSSTRHEMMHLFPLISPGGILIVDDYGALEGARKAVDEYLAEKGIKLFLQRVDFTVRLAIVAYD